MWNTSGFEPLPIDALRIRRLRSGLVLAGVALALALFDVGMRAVLEVDPPIPVLVVPGILTLVTVSVWWPWTRLSWRAWGWRLDPATFQTRSGVYTKAWKGVPRDRVQFVEVTSGPLQRSAGLATLVVRTAGVRTPAVHVEDLEVAVAEHLRAELSPQASWASTDGAADVPGDDELGWVP